MVISCRNAFLSTSKRFVEKDLEVSVAGRSFMITGANSGIGKATAMAIAKKGTTLTVVSQKHNSYVNTSWTYGLTDTHVLWKFLVSLPGVTVVNLQVIFVKLYTTTGTASNGVCEAGIQYILAHNASTILNRVYCSMGCCILYIKQCKSTHLNCQNGENCNCTYCSYHRIKSKSF